MASENNLTFTFSGGEGTPPTRISIARAGEPPSSFASRFEAEFSRRPSIDLSIAGLDDLNSPCFPAELLAGSIVNVQLMYGDIEFESDIVTDPTNYDVAVVLERLCRKVYGKNVHKCPIVCDAYLYGVGGDGCSAAPSHDGPLVLPEWPPAQVLESSFSMILCPVQVSSSECAS